MHTHTHRSSIIRDSCSSSIHILANQNRKQSAILHKTLVKWWSLSNPEIILQNMPGSPDRKGNKEITGPFCHLLDLVLEMEVK